MEFSWIYNISPHLATFFLAMLPVTELRASIPIALESFHLPVYQAFILSVVGGYIPGIVIIYYIEPISRWLRKKSKFFDRFFDWLFSRTRKKFNGKYAVWGNLALMLFVAIPLPGTGVWTGSLAAWLFNVKKRDALIFVGLGAILAGVLVTLISLGVINIFKTFV